MSVFTKKLKKYAQSKYGKAKLAAFNKKGLKRVRASSLQSSAALKRKASKKK